MKKFELQEFKNILTGFINPIDDTLTTICNVTRAMPMLSVIKHNKNKSDAVIKERLLFEVDFPDEHVFSMNYISYFSIEDCNFLVLSRLFTSKFAVVNIDATTLNPHYFGVDWLTSIITAIHWTKDSRWIIGGYETGSIAIWNIIEIVDEYKNSSIKKKAVLKDDLLPFKLEFRTLLSSSAVDSSEIIAIDSNYDSEMFIAVSKSLNITLHSIGNGQCLNWIKLSQHNWIVQGVQLSKNGYQIYFSTKDSVWYFYIDTLCLYFRS